MDIKIEQAIAWALTIAADNDYYYVSPPRPPYGMDCSYFVIHAFQDGAGVDCHGASDTSNMISCMTQGGTFLNIPFNYAAAQRGDIFMWDGTGTLGHACIYLGNGRIVHAANSSQGILEAPYNPDTPFTDILRYNGLPVNPQWHAKSTGGYAQDSVEAIENALMILTVLSGLGWSLQAVCGLLGNLGSESGYNPWRWEGDVVLPYGDPRIATSMSNGYGLVQFTPPGKYILDLNAQLLPDYGPNYSDSPGNIDDGNAQLNFINNYADYNPTTAWPQTYAEYKIWGGSPEDAASIWIHNYERPLSYSTEPDRRAQARYWYDLLGGYTPQPPKTKGLPPWFINKLIRKEL